MVKFLIRLLTHDHLRYDTIIVHASLRLDKPSYGQLLMKGVSYMHQSIINEVSSVANDLTKCVAPISGTQRCGQPMWQVLTLKVPGGTIKGAACPKHVDFVKQLLRDAAKGRAARAAAL